MSQNQFKPAWWLRNPHLQTIWPVLTRRRRKLKQINIERERFELYDGDFVDLDWVGKDLNGPLVLMLHGFEGSINSHYAKTMLYVISQHGWRGVFMHFRGCSGEPNRYARGYHSGETRDVSNVMAVLREREPDTLMAAIGYSLGGNILLKWLGETGDQNPLKAAVAISVPFELNKASARIQQGFSRFYQWYFLKCLRDRLMQKFQQVPPPTPLNAELLSDVRTMHDFDDYFTAPLHGFSSADEYYELSSSRQYLKTIAVPTLVLHAKDDPFMTEDVIPTREEISPQVRLEVTENGGHVGFVEGKYPWRPEYWLEKRIPAFFREFF